MASMVPNSLKADLVRANINFASDTVKVMLLTSSYTPNKDSHSKRSNLSNEVSGTGYTAGGEAVTITIQTLDTAADLQEVTLGGHAWAASSITARYAAYYKSRGGASSADELIFINDFGADVTSFSGTFTLAASALQLVEP